MKQPSYFKGGVILLGIALIILLISVGKEFGFWFSICLLAVIGITLIYSLANQVKRAIVKPVHRLYAKDFSLRLIATLMGLLLVSGTLLYLRVFSIIEHDAYLAGDKYLNHRVEFSNAEVFFRSLICSLDLFMLDVDSNILDRLDNHAYLKGWLAILAAISFACTIAMLVGLVYSRLRAYYRLNYATRITDSKNHLYLFFGNNEPSELLIKDILEHDPKAVAIIIDVADIKEDAGSEWESIVGLIVHKQNVVTIANQIGAHVTIASQQLSDIERLITSREDFDAFGFLGLSKIKKFIYKLLKTTNPQLHIFFMEEDEDLNIRNIITLAKDITISSIAQKEALFHCIYCHARQNGPNRVIQDIAVKKNLNIKIVDSSHLAIELLKFDSDCHPVNVVKTSRDKLATVESSLKTLIVGFGEVGRDAFRFLYEFGAFVNAKDVNTRSPFECVIVDKNLDSIKGTMMASMPGIFQYNESARVFEANSVKFEAVDYGSQEFYTSVLLKDNFLEQVNYIIISIDNNDDAIALATRIFNHIRRVRQDISNLRIFVRCTDDNKVESIQKIADHYNYGYGNGENNTPIISIFGQPAKIYSYDLIVSDRLRTEGEIFHKKYCEISEEGKSWDERHKLLTDTGTPDIEKLRKLHRHESQDMANALHAGTKMILLKNAMNELAKESDSVFDWRSFCQRYFRADGSMNFEGSRNNIRYPGLSDKENEIILRIAQLEHLRWNAAHELMGYVFNDGGKECDERTMRHNCLCAWNQLDIQSDMITSWSCDYKKYDFRVVDTTIALNKQNLI